MALIITKAENDDLRKAVFALRYKVFSEEQTIFTPNKSKITFDRFDKCPATQNYICLLDSKPVASYRISLDGPSGFPVEDFYDLSQIRAISRDSKIGLISLGCIEKEVRSSGVYQKCLYQMRKSLSDKHCDFGAVVIRKDLADSFSKWGFKTIENFYCNRVKQWLSKMYVEVKNFGKDQTEFIGKTKTEKFIRKMTVYLKEHENFHFSKLVSLGIDFSHIRSINGEVLLKPNEQNNIALKPFEIFKNTANTHFSEACLISRGKSEIEMLYETA
ncbi:MAG: N-acyl amino acid synthase FeeM domain-containing protein [Bdellovibrio sp.]